MTSTMAFDTHAYVKKLRDVGVPEQQAEVQADALVTLVEERLATKQDLFSVETALKRDIKELEVKLERDMKELEAGLKHDMKELETGLKHNMKELETGLKHDMKELEMRLLIRLGTLLVVAVGAVATLVKIL